MCWNSAPGREANTSSPRYHFKLDKGGWASPTVTGTVFNSVTYLRIPPSPDLQSGQLRPGMLWNGYLKPGLWDLNLADATAEDVTTVAAISKAFGVASFESKRFFTRCALPNRDPRIPCSR
jgi:hypothetical protein